MVGQKQAKITISNSVCLWLILHLLLIILISFVQSCIELDVNTIRKLTEQHKTKNSSINITNREVKVRYRQGKDFMLSEKAKFGPFLYLIILNTKK